MKTFNLRDEGTITEIFRLKVWIKPVSVLAPPENENPTKRKGHFGDSCIHGRGIIEFSAFDWLDLCSFYEGKKPKIIWFWRGIVTERQANILNAVSVYARNFRLKKVCCN